MYIDCVLASLDDSDRSLLDSEILVEACKLAVEIGYPVSYMSRDGIEVTVEPGASEDDRDYILRLIELASRGANIEEVSLPRQFSEDDLDQIQTKLDLDRAEYLYD